MVAPIDAGGAPDTALEDGCAASGMAGDFEELHATAVMSPTMTTVSRKEKGAVMEWSLS
jgi:hypothetical protein